MVVQSKCFYSGHQPTGAGNGDGDDDDEGAARNYPSRKKNKRPISYSSDLELQLSTPNADADADADATVCKLSPSQKARIAQPFDRSLIAWVVGKDIRPRQLAVRLHRFLRLTQDVKVSELGLGYFVLTFSKTDYAALEKHPWSIPNLCIYAFPWIPNFKPSETTIPSVDVWIRLPELCIEYYDDEILQRIAETIGGTLVKIDPVTEGRIKCKFARICIRINLCNPLPRTIQLGRIRQEIEYEGFDSLCPHCRRVDDPKHDCLTNPSGSSGSSGFDPHHHRARSYQAVGSSSKQPLIPSESSPACGSRFQVLEKDPLLELNDLPSLPMGGCETAATRTSTNSPHVTVNVAAPNLAQKKHQLPGLIAKPVENQKETSGVSVQTLPNLPKESARRKDVPQSHPMSISSNPEVAPITIKAPELEQKNLIQSIPLAPSVVADQFRTAETSSSTALAFHNNQPQPPSSTASIPSLQPSPTSEAGLTLFLTGIQRSTIEKEIINSPSEGISVDRRPTVYTIDPSITSLAIGLSERPTAVSNQNQFVINFASTSSSGNKHGIGLEAVSASCSKKMLCWNFRGKDNTMLMRALKDLIQKHEPSIILIFGTMISGADADQVVQELSFCGSYCRNDYNGGVWLLLSRQDVQTEFNSSSPQHVSESVYFHPQTNRSVLGLSYADTETSQQPWGPNFFYTSTSWMDNTLAC